MDREITLGQKVEYKFQYSTEDLFPINREKRRVGYVQMFGVDVWTAYEFSFLLPNKLPQYYVLRIYNSCESVNIFESKGLKLYLNSFNNTVFESIEKAIETVERDLSQLAEKDVQVEVITSFPEHSLIDRAFCIDSSLTGEIDSFDYNPFLLKVEEKYGEEILTSNLLRSNCEITKQPDWARVYIMYQGERSINKESLLRYIISYRNHQEFHEPTCERIYQDLYRILSPDALTVICQYTRRGGIDINPIRSNRPLPENFQKLSKLLQQ